MFLGLGRSFLTIFQPCPCSEFTAAEVTSLMFLGFRPIYKTANYGVTLILSIFDEDKQVINIVINTIPVFLMIAMSDGMMKPFKAVKRSLSALLGRLYVTLLRL